MTTAAIIGAGELGGAVAHALAAREAVRRVVMVDTAGNAAAGKALDIQQMGAVAGWHTRLHGSSELADVIGCAVCIVADRFGPPSVEWRGEDGHTLLGQLSGLLGDAPLVLAGAHQMDLITGAVADGRYRRHRVVGSCTEAFASSVRAMVALEARCAPAEVSVTVLGAPPDGLVVVWSEAAIGGHALERVLTPVELTRIQARVSRLWPPGALNLGMAAGAVAEGIVRASRRACAVLTVLDGEMGVRGRVGAVSAFLNPGGVASSRTPSLSTRERVLLDTALGG